MIIQSHTYTNHTGMHTLSPAPTFCTKVEELAVAALCGIWRQWAPLDWLTNDF